MSRVGRVQSVEVGGITFERPITMLPLSEEAMVGASDAIGNIGGEIMRRFTVTLDYPRKRMILEPNAQRREPFDADMSGLGMRMGPDGSNALEVEWIQSDSPASKAGVRPNDLIERIDGRPALEIGVSGLRAMSRRDGERHVLSIRRGHQTLEVTLTNRRMI
jgi:C-terminal processing protease CtpA/Prc